MNQSTSMHRWWLLIAKGALYALMGVVLFMIADSNSALAGRLVGSLMVLAGISGFLFSYGNRRADKNYIWGVLQALFDVSFGVAFFIVSDESTQSFIEPLGYWAVIYAFLHAVQAMYAALTPNAGVTNYTGQLLEFVSVLLTGALAFMLISPTEGSDNSFTLIGIFLVGLGLLTVVLMQRLRAQQQVQIQ